MQKIFIVTLIFRKWDESPVHNNHFVSEKTEELALDAMFKSDTTLEFIKKGYAVSSSNVALLGDWCCPQNSPHTYGHLETSVTKEGIGVYINLQVSQTPELLEDLAALMQKHYQYTLPTTN